jgi:hypothetical protein
VIWRVLGQARGGADEELGEGAKEARNCASGKSAAVTVSGPGLVSTPTAKRSSSPVKMVVAANENACGVVPAAEPTSALTRRSSGKAVLASGSKLQTKELRFGAA